MITEEEFLKLKENTLIQSEERGVFLKGGDFYWNEVYPHCNDCAELLLDEGVTPLTDFGGVERGSMLMNMPAYEYFGDFKILALPVEEKNDVDPA